MKRWLLALLVALAALAGLAACWFGRRVLEALLGDVLKRVVDRAGPVGWAVLFLACGLSLAIGGPVVMARENRRRTTKENKPRYGCVEFTVVVAGGVVFTLVGVTILLGWF